MGSAGYRRLYRTLAGVDGALADFDGYWLALMDLSWL